MSRKKKNPKCKKKTKNLFSLAKGPRKRWYDKIENFPIITTLFQPNAEKTAMPLSLPPVNTTLSRFMVMRHLLGGV